MSNSRVRRIYFAENLRSTVTDSQIVSWLKLLERRDIVFDLAVMSGYKSYLSRRGEMKEKLEEATAVLSGRVLRVPVVMSRFALGQPVIALSLLSKVWLDALLGRPVLVQTRSTEFLDAFRMLKAVLPSLRIIYDGRDASAEEFLLGEKKRGRLSDEKILRKYGQMLDRERKFVRLSDRVFCVSRKLMEYRLEKDPGLDSGKVCVVPGCGDKEAFYWDLDARCRVRKALGMEGRLVLVYSGRLDKPWQMPEFTFEFFSRLWRKRPKTMLLCLTPDDEIVERYRVRFGVSRDAVVVRFVEYGELKDYLCAADVGLLLREDSPTNNVASPTKFAEYVLCGLPTIVSRGVGDFSDFVAEHGIGITTDNDIEGLVRDSAAFIDSAVPERERVARLGVAHYSKQAFLDRLVRIHEELVR